MNKQEIIEHIENNSPWTVNKEKSLICDLGGGKIKDGYFYVTYGYRAAVDKIKGAVKVLEQRDNTMTYDDFIEETKDML